MISSLNLTEADLLTARPVRVLPAPPVGTLTVTKNLTEADVGMPPCRLLSPKKDYPIVRWVDADGYAVRSFHDAWGMVILVFLGNEEMLVQYDPEFMRVAS